MPNRKLPPGIRESPYEPGVYFIKDTSWHVGSRYTLKKLLGSGSFSAVCLAVDNRTGEQVALKRIPNVLADIDHAKRVLREVCILRRLSHPNVIGLQDVFVTPAETGSCKLVNGKLQTMSLDLYLALEFCNGGDLFDLKGQLSADEVKWIMWQMLQAVKYLHSCNVWHRDIKSANIMLEQRAGVRIIKIGDFGSARSGYSSAIPARGSRQMVHSDSFAREADEDMHDVQTLPSRFRMEVNVSPYSRPLTRLVATPCYRAPEVVMSRGGYSNMLDMWSVGCIFGELLQRIARVGSATTPNLHIAPLFAVEGIPRTPSLGDCYMAGPSNLQTRRELDALFNVIGTPAWACVEEVQHESWRHYLRKLPGKAPSLYRRFGVAGEPAVDLLQRLLAFDPARRCGAEEALAHEYLSDMRVVAGQSERVQVAEAIETRSSSAQATPFGDEGTDVDMADVGEAERARGAGSVHRELSFGSPQQPQPHKAATPGKPPLHPPGHGGGQLHEQASTNGVGQLHGQASTNGLTRHYSDEKDPAIALALLEEEMARVTAAHSNDKDAACAALRLLLEREVAEVQEAHAARSQLPHLPNMLPAALPPAGHGLSNMLNQHTAKLQLDTAAGGVSTPDDMARQRLGHVADTWKGELDPEKHLQPSRHGEWTECSGVGTRPGPQWGVAVTPPGMQGDPRVAEAVRKQQLR